MKKLRRYLPGIIFLLVVLVLFSRFSGPADLNVSPGQTQETSTVSEVLQEITGNTGTTDSQDAGDTAETAEEPDGGAQETLPEDGSYTTKEDVSLYLVTYGHLPGNFVTKKEAEKAGWAIGSPPDKVIPPPECL